MHTCNYIDSEKILQRNVFKKYWSQLFKDFQTIDFQNISSYNYQHIILKSMSFKYLLIKMSLNVELLE